MKIPYLDLGLQHRMLRDEIESAIWRVINNSTYILGPEVEAFEKAFAEYLGVRQAIGTGSGTAALQVALMALGVGPGDEVIVPAMTFYATAEVVALLGAKPVFVDLEPASLAINPAGVAAAITKKTRVIIPVHLYGHPADMEALGSLAHEHNLAILEDCAHAHGAAYQGKRVGGLGTLGAFSFYPGKNLGTIGEAGAIATNDDKLAALCKAFRDHGSTKKFQHRFIGLNARMEGLHGAVLAVKLPHLNGWNEGRRRAARRYRELLAGTPVVLPTEVGDIFHVYHVFQVRVPQRHRIFEGMRDHGIDVTIHYPVAMHLHEGFAFLNHKKGDFPVAEKLAEETLSLPCFPEMRHEQIVYVVDTLLSLLSN